VEKIIQDNAIQPKNRYKGHCTCAVIPAFNEELMIGTLVLKMLHEINDLILAGTNSNRKTAIFQGMEVDTV